MSLTDNGADESAVTLDPPGTGRATALVLLVSSHFLLNTDSAIIEVALPTTRNNWGSPSPVCPGRPTATSLPSAVSCCWVAGWETYSAVAGCSRVDLWASRSPRCWVAPGPGRPGPRCRRRLAHSAVPAGGTLPGSTGERRGHKALGTLGAVAAVGGSAGYFLGGLLSCFAQRLLPPDSRGAGRAGVDFVSAVGVSAGMALLVHALVDAEPSNLLSARTCGLVLISLAMLSLVVVRQNRNFDPLFPLRILPIPEIRGANLVAALLNMAIGPVIFFL